MGCQRLAAIAAIVITSFAASPHNAAADTVYNVKPVSLSLGYELLGGTITTDGTTGAAGIDFAKANIIDYQIFIAGPINLTFSPANDGARILNLDSGVVVTETEIYVEAQNPGDPTAELRFEARETIPGNFDPSVQQVFWNQGGSPIARSRVGWGDSSGPLNQGTWTQTPMLDRLVIASVPEPGSGLLILAGTIAFVGRRTRRHRMRLYGPTK